MMIHQILFASLLLFISGTSAACAEDQEIFCPDAESEAEVMDCIRTNWDLLSEECRAELDEENADPEEEDPFTQCREDSQRLCPDEDDELDVEEILDCLVKNSQQLQEGCRHLLEDYLACQKDESLYCQDVAEDPEASYECMRSHWDLLSDQCKDAYEYYYGNDYDGDEDYYSEEDNEEYGEQYDEDYGEDNEEYYEDEYDDEEYDEGDEEYDDEEHDDEEYDDEEYDDEEYDDEEYDDEEYDEDEEEYDEDNEDHYEDDEDDEEDNGDDEECPCAASVEKYCSEVEGDHNIRGCLLIFFRSINRECQEALREYLQEHPDEFQRHEEEDQSGEGEASHLDLEEECHEDMEAFCGDVDRSAIHECVMNNWDNLSRDCQTAITQYRSHSTTTHSAHTIEFLLELWWLLPISLVLLVQIFTAVKVRRIQRWEAERLQESQF